MSLMARREAVSCFTSVGFSLETVSAFGDFAGHDRAPRMCTAKMPSQVNSDTAAGRGNLKMGLNAAIFEDGFCQSANTNIYPLASWRPASTSQLRGRDYLV